MQPREPARFYPVVFTPRLERPLVGRGGRDETGDVEDALRLRVELADAGLFSFAARFPANASTRSSIFFAAAIIALRLFSHPLHAITSSPCQVGAEVYSA